MTSVKRGFVTADVVSPHTPVHALSPSLTVLNARGVSGSMVS